MRWLLSSAEWVRKRYSTSGLPVALAFIVQMLTASLFYRSLNGRRAAAEPAAAGLHPAH